MFRLFLLLITVGLCQAANVHRFWDVTWVNAAPDNYTRPVIGINGKWPCPLLDVQVGDVVTIVLTNKLGNQTTGLHWHGIDQKGTNQMDGSSGVTQCPVPPGSTFTYEFTADTPGTYWYHSHNMGQYPDGLRGPLIVRDPNPPWKTKVDKEYVLTVTDWYRKQMPDLISAWQVVGGSNVEPVPDSLLINDGMDNKYDVEPGKTYLFRIINWSAFATFLLNFKDHNVTVVAMDNVYAQEYTWPTLVIGSAMRYDVLVTAKSDASQNFGIIAAADMTMFRGPSPNPQFRNATLGYLIYDKSKPLPTPHAPPTPPLDDALVKPLDGQKLLGPVTKQYILDFNMTKIQDVPRAVINGISYLPPKVPSLYTALSVGKDYATNMEVYGNNTNSMRVDADDIVEVVINNYDTAGHPWHLHGHQFQIVARSTARFLPNAKYNESTPTWPTPMRKDTVGVQPGGYVVIRFKADNPGAHLIHCHVEWHVEAGMSATFIEAADKLDLKLPYEHKLACIKQGMPYQGNAAGNTEDPLDLTGENTDVTAQNYGATYAKSSSSSGSKLRARDFSA